MSNSAVELNTIPGSTVSQIQISEDTYDIVDVSTRTTVAELCDLMNEIYNNHINMLSVEKINDTSSDALNFTFDTSESQKYSVSFLDNGTIEYKSNEDSILKIPTIKKCNITPSETLQNAGTKGEDWKLEGEVYQIGHLVTGSLLLKDSKAIDRDNINYNYTLINDLPKPSTDIIFKCTTKVKGTAFLKLQHSDGYLK